jgi:hypothetical protein
VAAARIARADEAQLDAWTERFVTAASLDALLAP